MTVDTYEYVGYYTVVLTQHYTDAQETIRKILGDCWSLYIANAIVLAPSEDYQIVYIFTYFPYTPEHCEHVEPVINDYFVNGSCTRNATIFPDKLQNLHKCPLKMSLYDFPPFMMLKPLPNESYYIDGIEGTIIRVLSQRLNFTPIVLLSTTNLLRNITKSNTELQSKYPRSLDLVKTPFLLKIFSIFFLQLNRT